jgi:putative ABC transport system permease protein
MKLTSGHIEYIAQDVAKRGIVDDDLQEELVDHICSLVEERTVGGERFVDAYEKVIRTFGKESFWISLQQQTFQSSNNNVKLMVKNYFKIAYRNLIKHSFYTAVNVIGLSIGVACSLMIMLYVASEKNYDSFHEGRENIYRIITDAKYGDNEFTFPVSAAPMGPTLAQEITEVEQAVRLRTRGMDFVQNPAMEEKFKEENIVFADSGFFDLFTFPIIEGNKTSPLRVPNTMAISESVAKKYFPGTSAINKTLLFRNGKEYAITAVYADMPSNSHLKFDFIVSMASITEEANNGVWLSNNFYTYIRLKPDVPVDDIKRKADRVQLTYVGAQIEQFIGKSMAEFEEGGNYFNTVWQPLSNVYLDSDFIFDVGRTGNGEYIALFSVIAIIIIVLACINFMNLATARSAHRAKEVGVRKVLGSYRSHLVRQFLMESVLMSLLAFVIGICLISLILPYFNMLADKGLALPWSNPLFTLTLVLASIGIGLIAGIYPALFLSSFKPAQILKGRFISGSRGGAIRSGLVVFQFFISILLITGTIAIHKQLKFMQNKKIGFEKNQILLIKDTHMLGEQRQSFKDEILQLSQVKSASYSGFLPVNGYNRTDNSFWPEGESPTEDNLVSMQFWKVDPDYIKTYGIELFAGRDFNKDMVSDSVSIIINEKAMKAFGFTPGEENSVLSFSFDPETGASQATVYDKYKVIGYIRDFHYESMKENIGPLALVLGQDTGILSVKLATDDFASSMDQLEQKWTAFSPGLPFTYEFLDAAFGTMYRSEMQLSRVFALFAGLAIFIGCLGLFALASFMAEQRTKEIGIRKVMGASVKSIILMLSKQFSLLIIISFVLAVPLAWWGIERWLTSYTYKINIGIDLFILAAVFSFLIAGLTVGYQSIKAATSNPVDSLRSE